MKKSSEGIKQEILKSLEAKPLSIQQIGEKIDSNWLTVRSFVDELLAEGKIRCVISTDKIKVYRLADYPVFYSIPLSKGIRNDILFMHSEIVKEWKKQKGDLPLTTTLHKIAVEVIKDCKLNLPVLPFHYGLVTPISIKPEEGLELEKRFGITPPKESSVMINYIKKIVPEHKNDSGFEEDRQYQRYPLFLFSSRKRLMKEFKTNDISDKIDPMRVEEAIINVSMNFPLDKEVYGLFERFVYISIIILHSKEYKKYLRDIKETFEVIWDLATTHLYLKEASKIISNEDRPLFDLIRTSQLNVKFTSVEERLSNIESISNCIDANEIKMPMDEESIAIRRILAEGAEEE